jgi:ABC-type nitrate/sulfonate/bicarbonate transport system substrate-binding protein
MDKVRLALEWFWNPDHVPLVLGRDLGWFAEAGLDVEIIEPTAHLDPIRDLVDGNLDVAITEPIHLVQDRAKGQPVVGFARFLHTNGGVMYFRGRGIERPRDMAKKRIQYPGAPGPGGIAIVRTMIEADGGTCDPAELVPVNCGFSHTNALADDKADVATLAFYNFEVIEARHRGYDAEFFALKDWGVPDFCQLVLISNERFLADRHDVAARLVRVLRRGIDFIHERPIEARELYERAIGGGGDAMAAAIFAATVPCFTHDFSMAREYYASLEDYCRRTGQIAAGTSAEGCWTNTLAI